MSDDKLKLIKFLIRKKIFSALSCLIQWWTSHKKIVAIRYRKATHTHTDTIMNRNISGTQKQQKKKNKTTKLGTVLIGIKWLKYIPKVYYL